MVRKESQKRELGEDSNGKSFKLFCMEAQEELLLSHRFVCEQQHPHFVVKNSGIILRKLSFGEVNVDFMIANSVLGQRDSSSALLSRYPETKFETIKPKIYLPK